MARWPCGTEICIPIAHDSHFPHQCTDLIRSDVSFRPRRILSLVASGMFWDTPDKARAPSWVARFMCWNYAEADRRSSPRKDTQKRGAGQKHIGPIFGCTYPKVHPRGYNEIANGLTAVCVTSETPTTYVRCVLCLQDELQSKRTQKRSEGTDGTVVPFTVAQANRIHSADCISALCSSS